MYFFNASETPFFKVVFANLFGEKLATLRPGAGPVRDPFREAALGGLQCGAHGFAPQRGGRWM